MNKPFASPLKPRLLPEGTRMGAVHLAVTDAERALLVWRDIVGLTLHSRDGGVLRLGAGTETLVVLHVEATAPVAPKRLGLYHVAIHVPMRADLARFVVRAARAGLKIGPTDHLVTEAVYCWDGDGNGIELTFETPWRGSVGSNVAGAYATTADGQPHSGREALDMTSLLGELGSDPDRDAALPAGTRIGHVHVHVRDLDAAMGFYAGTLGFEPLVLMRDWGMGDAGLGYMPHAIAFNIWAGANARRAPEGAAGLKWFEMHLPEVARAGLELRLAAASAPFLPVEGGIETQDPAENRLRLIFA